MKTGAKIISVLIALLLTCVATRAAVSFGELPLWFEADSPSTFTARGPGSQFTINAKGIEFSLAKAGAKPACCQMEFTGTVNPLKPTGLSPLTGKINRLQGNQPEGWQRDVAIFSRVQLNEVYPGIDVIAYANQDQLEYDFNIAPGADPKQIQLRFVGADNLTIERDGSLTIHLNGGKITQHPPIAYQMVGGKRLEVPARFILDASKSVRFALGAYDHTEPLIVDPVLTYSTYFGGKYGEYPSAIAIGVDGSIYVAGETFSPYVSNSIPLATPGAFQTNYHGGKLTGDAFVLRFDATGTNLIYATYLGGSGNDGALGLAVDAIGNAFLTGFTDSTNFPVTNALYPKISSPYIRQIRSQATDIFVSELNPAGNSLVYSTYLGGNSMDAAYGIALDEADNAYITGYTYSTNFPVTPGAFQPTLQCSNTVYINANAFVSVIAAGGGSLSYSTYLGGTNFDTAKAIAYNNGRVFVTGFTYSTNFPSTNHLTGYDYLNGDSRTNRQRDQFTPSDAFVTAFDASTPVLSILYSTFLGGTNNDVANAIAADAAGNAYVAGYTMSTNYPYTTTNVAYLTPSFVRTNDFKKRFTLATNGFLTQIKWDGSQPAIGYSTMLGGVGVNVANGVAVDLAGNAYVIGSATCTNWPITPNIEPPLSATNNSRKRGSQPLSDAVVIAFNSDASALLYSAYLGGKENDFGNAIAVDTLGNAYLTGFSASTNFPTVNPWKSYRTGSNDLFIAKISPDSLFTISLQPNFLPGSEPKSARFNSTPAHNLKLRWQMSPPGLQLQRSTDISHTNWLPVGQPPVFSNGAWQLDLAATNRAEFFRFAKP